MEVIIRTDASTQIGSGHVMRCLTIANKLREQGINVKFWMEALPGHLIDVVKKQGFQHIEQAQQADLYIIDHYRLGVEWERSIRPYTKNIMVIDDLAREHDCDLLLDQNVVPNFNNRYDGKVPIRCIKLLGPAYLMMRDEFIAARQQLRPRTNKINRLLVFMGGADPTNETMKVLKALQRFHFEHVDIVVGNSNPLKTEIAAICREKGYAYHCQINYMARLMVAADFAISAGGATMWERCYVGLPSSATIVADNQIVTTEFAASLGVVKNLGWHEQVTVATYEQLLAHLTVDNMSEKGLQLTQSSQPNAWLQEILELIK